jgi:hypothetical protein
MKRRSAFALAAAAWPLPISAVVAGHDGLLSLQIAAWSGFVLMAGASLLIVLSGLAPVLAGLVRPGAGRLSAVPPPIFFASWDTEVLARAAALSASGSAHTAVRPELPSRPGGAASVAGGQAIGANGALAKASAPGMEVVRREPHRVEVTLGLARLEAFANSAPPFP